MCRVSRVNTAIRNWLDGGAPAPDWRARCRRAKLRCVSARAAESNERPGDRFNSRETLPRAQMARIAVRSGATPCPPYIGVTSAFLACSPCCAGVPGEIISQYRMSDAAENANLRTILTFLRFLKRGSVMTNVVIFSCRLFSRVLIRLTVQ